MSLASCSCETATKIKAARAGAKPVTGTPAAAGGKTESEERLLEGRPLDDELREILRSKAGGVLSIPEALALVDPENSRWKSRGGQSYCFLHLSSVLALTAPKSLPDLISAMKDLPSKPGSDIPWPTALPRNANELARWIKTDGAKYDWSKVSDKEAQEYVNQGGVAIAVWENPGPTGHGHVAVLIPGDVTDDGPTIANVGYKNFAKGHVRQGFGTGVPDYWANGKKGAAGRAPPPNPVKKYTNF